MKRVLIVVQEKGGVGKSTLTRGVAEFSTDFAILEVDADHRLKEFGERVRFFRMRSNRAEIEKTGGRSSIAEFDHLIAALFESVAPAALLDVGANTSVALLESLNPLAEDFALLDIELGVLAVVTADPGALAAVPRLFDLADGLSARKFAVLNQLAGPLLAADFAAVVKTDDVSISALDELILDDAAYSILASGGLKNVPRISREALTAEYKYPRGPRIHRDCCRFRMEVMKSVERPAYWLAGQE